MWRLQHGSFPFWWNFIFYAEFCLLDKLYIAMTRLSFVHHDELMGQIGHDRFFILACANVLIISWVTCIKNCQNQYFDHFQIECWKELNVTKWNPEWKMKKEWVAVFRSLQILCWNVFQHQLLKQILARKVIMHRCEKSLLEIELEKLENSRNRNPVTSACGGLSGQLYFLFRFENFSY